MSLKDTGTVNPNSFPGAGFGYSPVRLGGRAMADPIKRNKTEVKITLTPDPVTAESTPCAFGKLVAIAGSNPMKIGIIGGSIMCGENTFNIEPQEISLDVAGTWLYFIKVDVVVTQDDDHEILLPGVESGSLVSTGMDKVASSNYPDGTLPSVGTGSGTIVLPIGQLTVVKPVGATEGTPTFYPTGCGSFVVTHCAGSLGYYRG